MKFLKESKYKFFFCFVLGAGGGSFFFCGGDGG